MHHYLSQDRSKMFPDFYEKDNDSLKKMKNEEVVYIIHVTYFVVFRPKNNSRPSLK